MRATVVDCPHAARCGGCAGLGVPYGAQLDAKRARLVASLAPYGLEAHLAAEVRGADPVVRYRTRLKWMAGPRGALGLFGRGGHTVVDTPSCQVAAPGPAAAADVMRGLLREPRFARVAASLRAVDLREVRPDAGAGELVTMVLIREERPARRDLEAFAAALREARPEVLGVAVNWVAKRSIQVLGPETEPLAGAASVLDRQGDVAVTASPGGFVQAHRGQAAAMSHALVAHIAGERATSNDPVRVLELFAGASPFGLALARAGCDVTAIEAFAPAAAGALAAARAQGLTLHAIAGDAEVETERLARAGARFDVVVVDPPRRGLSPRLRAAMAQLAPRAVAYVSCDPDTLARDLADLAWRGLAPTGIEGWDFVPLTDHVEALAWLAPVELPGPRELARAGGLRVVDAPPHLDLGVVAARSGGRGARPASPLPPGASGALVVIGAASRREDHGSAARQRPGPSPRGDHGGGAVLGSVRVVAAVRGVPRGRVRGVEGEVRVVRSGPGRALLAIDLARADGLSRLGDVLLRAGHPVLGDPRDPATARHVLEKHGVDRPLIHVARLEVDGIGAVEAPLAPDLGAALVRLGLGDAQAAAAADLAPPSR